MSGIAKAMTAAWAIALMTVVLVLSAAAATSDPVASWQFDEGAGATTRDAVGSLHGSILSACRRATWSDASG